MTSDPPFAPYPLSIRIDDADGPSRVSDELEQRGAVVVDPSTLPGVTWIEVNGRDYQGTFTIQARFEVDLLLILTGDACRVEARGTHPEGGPHSEPSG
jgi:hypothetical protein